MLQKQLKLIRNELGLTQKEISQLIEVSDKTWNQWESGKIKMHPAFLSHLEQKIRELYNVDLPKLLTSKQFNEKMTLYTQKDINNLGEQLANETHEKEQSLNIGDFSFIDLFAGVGGIRQAFESSKGYCVFSSEIDNFAKYTYYSNFGTVPYGDITKINEYDIPNHDVLCAGFPCQPFSHIGKREGFEHPTQGTMFHEIIRILLVKKPQAIFLENVPGLINHDDGNTLEVIVNTLRDIGYTVKHTLLDASHFGIPQKRRRFYLVGFLDKNTTFEFPQPPMISSDIGDFIEKNIEGYTISEHLQNSYLFKKDDGKPAIVDQNSKGAIKTLVSSYHKIQRLTGTFVKDGKTGLRLLSENECKAIMGFPKDFIIPVSRTQMYRQMGNSVVIPVITAVAQNIARALQESNTQQDLFDK